MKGKGKQAEVQEVEVSKFDTHTRDVIVHNGDIYGHDFEIMEPFVLKQEDAKCYVATDILLSFEVKIL